MRKSNLVFIAMIFLPFFVSCNSDELKALQSRLDAAESKLANEENKSASALKALQEGQCTVEDVDGKSALLKCGDGSSFTITNGSDGKDGDSCSVTEVEDEGALVTCGETMVMVYNGKDGLDGEDGSSSVLEVIDPCGDQGRFDEVLLRLEDGSILAHFSSGNRQFLTFIGPGNYRTTDGLGCRFSIDEDMNVSWD